MTSWYFYLFEEEFLLNSTKDNLSWNDDINYQNYLYAQN